MRAVFAEPSVVLLAIGGEHPLRAPCRAVLAAAAQGEISIHMSTEGGQEILYHRLRRVERERAIAEFDALRELIVWHDFDLTILDAARNVVAQGYARGRDAVHVATAQRAGFASIVSADRDFDGIPGLRRMDPSSWDA